MAARRTDPRRAGHTEPPALGRGDARGHGRDRAQPARQPRLPGAAGRVCAELRRPGASARGERSHAGADRTGRPVPRTATDRGRLSDAGVALSQPGVRGRARRRPRIRPGTNPRRHRRTDRPAVTPEKQPGGLDLTDNVRSNPLTNHSRRTFLGATGLAVAGVAVLPATARAATPSGLRGELDKYLDRLEADDLFSGTVLVTRDGRPVVSRSIGYADQEKGIRNRADTRYCLASVTKMFTATAIAQLAQRGSLSLVDPVGKYLTGFKPEIADHVTIHHLLTHTSGLGDYMQIAGYFEESATWTTPRQMMDGTLRYIRTESLAFTPGAGSKYSNSAFHVLGCIVEKISGESYYDYIRKHVFRPAGMTASDFTLLSQWKTDSRFAHPYPTDEDGKRYDALDRGMFGVIGSPAGNAFATAPDLVRFARALNDGTLVSATYRDVFVTPKFPMPPLPAKPGLPEVTNFIGYGMDSAILNGVLITGHLGGAPGISTSTEWYPGRGWTAIHLGNYDAAPGANVNQELRQLLAS
ncbi:class A beta-lactamase-related serine hydrolase [Kribbella speibonae]|uniref:Class A beta-lactamase-related serine hydrolase n=1 Tax=Kribbella speibonae TaxID=1572660 RepID=A0ABY1ZTZ6_9ACTN|nr:class A beta-lactamase-related serine hydrolase [Kribbella speibonae]